MLKKFRILTVTLVLCISVTYAALLPEQACKGCSSWEMCYFGGNYLGSGYPDCYIYYDLNLKPVCVPVSDLGLCSGGN